MLKILLPVDGSEAANRATDHVIALARDLREAPEIHVLTVHPPVPYARVASVVGHETLNRFYREEGEETLKGARARLDQAKVAYQFHIGVGDPAEIIARYVSERGIGRIVMGTRGMGAVSNLLIGSVASKVMHLVDCPVTLVR